MRRRSSMPSPSSDGFLRSLRSVPPSALRSVERSDVTIISIKHRSFVVKTHTFAMSLLALGVAAMAQTQTPNKVGVIQIQSAIVSTKDGQKAAAELETRLGPKRKELEKKQADIKEMQDKLQRGGNAMAETAKQDLMRTIDQRTKSFNRDMEDAQAEF